MALCQGVCIPVTCACAQLPLHCTQTCCSDSVNINMSTGQVEVQLHDVARKAPLLLTELVVTTDNTNFCYSTHIDTIASRIIATFDRALTKLQVGRLAAAMQPVCVTSMLLASCKTLSCTGLSDNHQSIAHQSHPLCIAVSCCAAQHPAAGPAPAGACHYGQAAVAQRADADVSAPSGGGRKAHKGCTVWLHPGIFDAPAEVSS